MKATGETVDYRGEHVGVRVGAERCQAIVRDYDKKTWSIYGAPDSYPRDQKYWTSGYSLVRMAVHVLRNEVRSDLLDVLTGKTNFASAMGCSAGEESERAPSKRTGERTTGLKASPAPVRTRVRIESPANVSGHAAITRPR